jgi:hypothetical protein
MLGISPKVSKVGKSANSDRSRLNLAVAQRSCNLNFWGRRRFYQHKSFHAMDKKCVAFDFFRKHFDAVCTRLVMSECVLAIWRSISDGI